MFPNVVVMGISGAGKSTLAKAIADRLDFDFIEGDDLHSPANLVKMTAGIALTTADRGPWLSDIRTAMNRVSQSHRGSVVACSSLRRSYRDQLAAAENSVVFVHLVGDPEIIRERMSRRVGHFMPPTLLDDQLATLEPLETDENGFEIPVDLTLEEMLALALRHLGSPARSCATTN
jgi:gluconokinase